MEEVANWPPRCAKGRTKSEPWSSPTCWLADDDRQRGGGRSHRGGDAEVWLGLSRLRPICLHVSRCRKAMSIIANCKWKTENCKLPMTNLQFANLQFAIDYCRRGLIAACRGDWAAVPTAADRRHPRRAGRSLQGRVVDPGGSDFAGRSEALRGELSLVVPDGDGVPSRVTKSCRLAPGQYAKERLLCRFGRVNCAMTAEVRADGAVVTRRHLRPRTSRRRPFSAGHRVPKTDCDDWRFGIGGGGIGKLAESNRNTGRGGTWRLAIPADALVRLRRRRRRNLRGQGGIDSKLAADSAPMRALDEWVRMAGDWYCASGRRQRRSWPPTPANAVCPGRLEKMVSLRQTGALESFCGSRSGVPQNGNAKTVLRVPIGRRARNDRGPRGDLPLVVRTARGFGQVHVCGRRSR